MAVTSYTPVPQQSSISDIEAAQTRPCSPMISDRAIRTMKMVLTVVAVCAVITVATTVCCAPVRVMEATLNPSWIGTERLDIPM